MHSNQNFNLRQMNQGDLRDVLRWRNAANVRRYSFSDHIISWDEHLQWFDDRCDDPSCHLMIYHNAGVSIGFAQIRQINESHDGEWGFYLAPNAPKGTGTKLGVDVLDYAFKILCLRKVCARVLAANQKSILFHCKLGFQEKIRKKMWNSHKNKYEYVFFFELDFSDWILNR